MSHPARVPHQLASRKPPHGSPCNRCGVCCFATLCDLAQAVFRRPFNAAPCPALLFDEDGNSACGLTIAGTDEGRAHAAVLIRAGQGCDARINGEPVNRAFHALSGSARR